MQAKLEEGTQHELVAQVDTNESSTQDTRASEDLFFEELPAFDVALMQQCGDPL